MDTSGAVLSVTLLWVLLIVDVGDPGADVRPGSRKEEIQLEAPWVRSLSSTAVFLLRELTEWRPIVGCTVPQSVPGRFDGTWTTVLSLAASRWGPAQPYKSLTKIIYQSSDGCSKNTSMWALPEFSKDILFLYSLNSQSCLVPLLSSLQIPFAQVWNITYLHKHWRTLWELLKARRGRWVWGGATARHRWSVESQDTLSWRHQGLGHR